MRARAILLGLGILAGLSACGSGRDEGGASPDEQRQLNEAAASLDANSAVPADDQGNSQ